ncbi:MAG: DUF4091 domain-containing protein [Clostridia bacterium]|nr:DUF4091 domain-containing protein [Clostridia bacterium]
MIKRFVRGMLIAVMTVAALPVAACGSEPAKQKGDADVWGVNAAVKVLQDWEKSSYGNAVTEAKMVFDCIKGETESAQFIATPKENVSAFDFTVGEIANENGTKLEADLFEVFAQKYIEVVQPSNNPAPSKGMAHYVGWWPDAIIPMAKYKAVKENKIKADENQGIWVNVNVPDDAEVGTYTGKGVLTLDEEEYEVPITVNVYDLTLPKAMHDQLAFGLWYGHIAMAGVSVKADTYETYYWWLANRRITPTAIVPDYDVTPQGFANAVVKYAKSAIVSGYNLDVTGYGEDYADVPNASCVRYSYLINVFNAMIDKNIELREAGEKTELGEDIDLFKKLYIYLGSFEDEPTAAQFEVVRENDRRIARAKAELKSRLDEYPDIQESFIGVNHVVTTSFNEQLVGTDETGGVQTWCSTVGQYQTEQGRQLFYDRLDNAEGRDGGEKTWWYFCEADRSPKASYFLDDNLISARLTTYMQYDYRVSGHLFWCVNNATHYDGNSVPRDYWKDPRVWFNVNGDGYLTYPGAKYLMTEPISSIRLETLREAEEDYEYFWMLEQEVAKYNAAHGTSIDARAIVRGYFSDLYTGVIVDLDSTKFAPRRVEFIKFLEGVVKDGSALAQYA